MNYLDLDYQRITPNMLEKAMVHFGWSKIKTYPNKKAVWASQSGEFKQWLPLDDSFDDYHECVLEAVQSISKNSNISICDIDLYLKQFFYDKDLVQLRIDAEDVNNGSILFNDGVDMFGTFKQIVLGAVKEVAGAVKEVKSSFFNDCELGQTAIGSYVVNAYLPVLENTNIDDSKQPRLNHIEPHGIGRKINQTLINRLIALQKAMVNYSNENSTDVVQGLLGLGYTKSECVAIGHLFGKNGHRNWEIKVLWSNIETISPDQESYVRFDKAASSNAREIASKFKSVKYKDHLVLIGSVTRLARDYVQDSGKIIFESKVDDKEVKISVILDNIQYKLAADAHRTKTHVQITGHLIIANMGRKKTYVMNHVEDVKEAQYKFDFPEIDDEDDDIQEMEF
jgi:hypothetical protein